jgi:hypothetical protein
MFPKGFDGIQHARSGLASAPADWLAADQEAIIEIRTPASQRD